MMLKSQYHEFDKEEFLLYVIREDDEYYYVQHVAADYERFQEGDSITPLRKALVGDNGLYKIYPEFQFVEQLSLF